MAVVVIAALLAANWAETAWAASGQLTASAGKGLQLVLDTQWVDGSGYRPVWIDITPTAPVTADRTLHVEFKVVMNWYTQRVLIVSQDIDIPAGTTTTLTAQLSVPQHFSWQTYQLNVFEDGKEQKTLSQLGGFTRWGQQIVEGLPAVLVITDQATTAPVLMTAVLGPGGKPTGMTAPSTAPNKLAVAAPKTDVLADVLPVENIQTQRYGAVQATTEYPADLLAAVAIDRLPQRWIDYSSIDLICVSLAQLQRLATNHLATFAAIRHWNAAGGNLLVSGIGGDFAKLADLERLLDLERADGVPPVNVAEFVRIPNVERGPSNKSPVENGAQAENASPLQETAGASSRSVSVGGPRVGWKSPNKNDYNRDLGPPFGKSNNGMIVTTTANGQQTVVAVQAPPNPPERPAFVTRPIELGTVVAIAADDPFAEPPEVWGWILRTLTPDRWAWYRRHGVSHERENTEFWNWLVPGVGLAPVNEFRVLITVFVIVIGPLNYYWLKRRAKLHLLLVIVPLCAFLVTSGLFGYAVLADGLGVRVRARSYTDIDQRRGEAVCWARISYHAGLSPSGGLNFPADVAVTPIYADDVDNQSRRPSLGVIWSETEQNLASGWLPSRTPTQLLTVRSRPSAAGVRWLAPAKAGDPPRIENRLETRIERLLLADDEGNHFRALDVASGATVSLEKADVAAEETELVKLYRAGAPAVPQGFDQTVYSTLGNARFGWRRSFAGSLPAASLNSSRLEKNLRELPGVFGTLPKPLPPSSYVAFVDCSPELVWGVNSPQPEASLHLVVGRW